MQKPCSMPNSTLNFAVYTLLHHEGSVPCCFIVFERLHSVGLFQWEQVYKTLLKLIFVEIHESKGNNKA